MQNKLFEPPVRSEEDWNVEDDEIYSILTHLPSRYKYVYIGEDLQTILPL